MKLLKVSLLLISLSFALLLSGAETRNPRQEHRNGSVILAQHPDNKSKENKDTRIQNAPVLSSKNLSSAKDSVDRNPDSTKKKNGANEYDNSLWNVVGRFISGITTQGFFAFVTTFATTLLAIFTFQIVNNSGALQRAYIEVNFPNEFMLQPAIESVFTYQIGNTGPTRAYIKTIRSIVYIDRDWPIAEPLPDQTVPNQYILAASTSVNRNVRIRSLSLSEIEAISSREIKIVVHGFVVYVDIFKRRRFTRFCREYEPPIKRFIPPTRI